MQRTVGNNQFQVATLSSFSNDENFAGTHYHVVRGGTTGTGASDQSVILVPINPSAVVSYAT